MSAAAGRGAGPPHRTRRRRWRCGRRGSSRPPGVSAGVPGRSVQAFRGMASTGTRAIATAPAAGGSRRRSRPAVHPCHATYARAATRTGTATSVLPRSASAREARSAEAVLSRCPTPPTACPLGVHLARDLAAVLGGLGAAVEQGRLLGVVARGQLGERLGHGHVPLVRRDHETGVREVGELGGGTAYDGLGGGADRGHRDARAEVDQPVAVDVLDDPAARTRGEHGQYGAHALGDRGGTAGLQLLRLRARDGGDEAALLRKCGHEGLLGGVTDTCLLFSQARAGRADWACSMWALSRGAGLSGVDIAGAGAGERRRCDGGPGHGGQAARGDGRKPRGTRRDPAPGEVPPWPDPAG
ncbi:hypothetical protein SHIRM173S_05171 [Streptomyces hirsutus]